MDDSDGNRQLMHGRAPVWALVWVLCVGCATGEQAEGDPSARPADIPARSQADDSGVSRDETAGELEEIERALQEGRWHAAERLARSQLEAGTHRVQAAKLLAAALRKQGRHLAGIEVIEELRADEPAAVSAAELSAALASAINSGYVTDPRQRLDLRLALARVAPEHPAGSAGRIFSELHTVANHHRSGRRWHKVLAATQSLLAARRGTRLGEEIGSTVFFLHAEALWQAGYQEQARQAFVAYLDEGPASLRPQRFERLLHNLSRIGELQLAVKLLDDALGAASFAPDRQRLMNLIRLGDVKMAAADSDERADGEAFLRYCFALVEQSKPDAQVYAELSRVLTRYGMADLQAKVFRRRLRAGFVSRYEVQRHVSNLLKSDELAQVRDLVDAYLAKRPDPNFLQNVSRWHTQAGFPREAFAYQKRAAELEPEAHDRWRQLAELAFNIDEDQEAIEALRRYVEHENAVLWQIQSAMAMLERQNHAAEALELLRDAARDHPQSIRLLTHLFDLLRDQGEDEKADKLLAELVEEGGEGNGADRTGQQLVALAGLIERELGSDEAFPLYERAARQGNEHALVRVVGTALADGDADQIERLREELQPFEHMNFHSLTQVWYQSQHLADADLREELLKQLLAKAPAGQKIHFRTQLTVEYLNRDDVGAVFELWGESRPLRFAAIPMGSATPQMRQRLIDAYDERYPNDEAAGATQFFIAEQHYALRQMGAHGASEPTRAARLARARELYKAALDGVTDTTILTRAASFLESRNMLEAAEAALIRLVRAEPGGEQGWYQYGQFLVLRQRYEAAEHVFLRYLHEVQSPDHAFTSVASAFAIVGEHERAERFYRMALGRVEEGDLSEQSARNLLAGASQGLAQLMLERGRLEAFLELTSDYADKYRGEHPNLQKHDRPIDLAGLRERGLWEPFVERLETLSDVEELRERVYYPQALLSVGRIKEAWKAYEARAELARHNLAPQWMHVANHLDRRGAWKLAATAYDRAVREARPLREAPMRVARAQYLITRGHDRAALADFWAIADSSLGRKHVFQTMLTSFEAAGRKEIALEAARRPDSPFADLVAARVDDELLDLSTHNLTKKLLEKAAGGADVSAMLADLASHGRADVIGEFVQQQIADGRSARALQVIVVHSGALDAADLLDPLLEQITPTSVHPDDLQARFTLFNHYLSSGQYRKALEKADASTQYRRVGLVSLHLAQPPRSSDSSYLAGWLRSGQPNGGLLANEGLAAELIRFGRIDYFSRMLERLARVEKQVNLPVELFVSDLFHRRGSAAVFSFLRRSAEVLAQEGPSSMRLVANQAELIRAMALAAAQGYPNEVVALVEELPEPLRRSDQIIGFAERLGVDHPASEQAEAAPAQPARARSATTQAAHVNRLHIQARTLLAEGHDERVERLLVDAIEQLEPGIRQANARQMYGRGYVGAQYRASMPQPGEQLAELLLAVYEARGDADGGRRVIHLWDEKFGFEEQSRVRLVDMLVRHGYFADAAAVADELAGRFPTQKALEKAVLTAARSGDMRMLETYLPAYWRQWGLDGGVLREHRLSNFVRLMESEPAKMLIERYLQARPAAIGARIAQIRASFRGQNFEEGRDLIRRYTEAFAGSENALGRLIAKLVADGHDVEVARVLGPAVDVEDLSDQSLVHLGRANLEIGRHDEAMNYFERTIEDFGDPELAAARLVRELAVDGYDAAASELCERFVPARPRLRASFLARGLCGLAGGKKQAGADIERGLRGRRGDIRLFRDVVAVALAAGDDTLAERYLLELLRIPHQPYGGAAHPIHEAVWTLIRAGRAGWGVEFFDRHMPALVAQPYLVTSTQWTNIIGELFTAAGLGERAEAWYARSLRYHQLSTVSVGYSSALLEARAYNLLVNGGDSERAESLSQRALVVGGSSNPKVLATRALAQHKTGDAAGAHRSLQRAFAAGFRRASFPELRVGNLEQVVARGRIEPRSAQTQPFFNRYNLTYPSHRGWGVQQRAHPTQLHHMLNTPIY